MQTKLSYLILLLICCSTHALAQHEDLANFTVNNVEEGVFLEWTIIAGTTCFGVTIERAADRETFSQIYHIDEVCGSVIEPISYTYLDPNPLLGQESSYRLILGDRGATDPVSIEYFPVDATGFSALIDAGTGAMLVYSLRTAKDDFVISVHDLRGALLREVKINGDRASIPVADLGSGLYILSIRDDNEIVYTQKFFYQG